MTTWNKLRIAIVGSRTFTNKSYFEEKVLELIEPFIKQGITIEVVSGGAKGTDTLAEQFAKDKGFLFKCFPADWETFGRSAGVRRNKEIIRYTNANNNGLVIAFWDFKSPGTKSTIQLARLASIPIEIVEI